MHVWRYRRAFELSPRHASRARRGMPVDAVPASAWHASTPPRELRPQRAFRRVQPVPRRTLTPSRTAGPLLEWRRSEAPEHIRGRVPSGADGRAEHRCFRRPATATAPALAAWSCRGESVRCGTGRARPKACRGRGLRGGVEACQALAGTASTGMPLRVRLAWRGKSSWARRYRHKCKPHVPRADLGPDKPSVLHDRSHAEHAGVHPPDCMHRAARPVPRRTRGVHEPEHSP